MPQTDLRQAVTPDRPKRPAKPVTIRSVAIRFGYATTRDMLEDLYLRNGESIRRMAVRIGKAMRGRALAYSSMKYHLEAHGIPLRGRGGPNYRGERGAL